tara:strand:- start:610 stop:2355 length:1746 start_codon:yes stop_codon:yes gene_type:complete
MNNYLFKFKEDLFFIIDDLIKNNIIESKFIKSNISIDYLSKSKQGDVSTNLYILLKKHLNDKSFNLENHIKELFKKIEYIREIKIAKAGFLNIFFIENLIISNLNDILIQKSNYGNNSLGNNKKINIEFVSANPTGPIHIAHIRGAVLGDVLSSILEANGYLITREYYVNDAGSQVQVLANSLYKRYQQLFNIDVKISDNDYPGTYLISIAKNIVEKDSDIWLQKDENQRIDFFKKFAITELINSIKNDLKLIGINFDIFKYESDIVKENLIEEVFKLLNKKELLYEGYLDKPNNGDIEDWEPRKQLLFKSSQFSDDKDRPFKKADGEWTYFANDAAYHYDKFLRKFSSLINIWGADHIGYISRMKSITEVISDKKDYLDIQICQIVRLIKNGKILKMSKREGNFITLKDILNQVGKDPLRYFMISNRSETPMDFDMDKVIEKNKDNPVFYCQYAFARASSVINKSKSYDQLKSFNDNFNEFDFSLLSKYEVNIILKLIAWPYLLYQIGELKQPHKLIIYLEDLCSDFHSFWNKGKDDQSLRFIDTNNIKKTITKLLWIESFRIVLKRIFDLIGIDAHENM